MLFRSIVPVVFVNVTVAALTVLENVVPPVCVRVIVPNAVPLPTAPVTLTVPLPVLKVKFCAELFPIVEPNEILLFVVVRVVAPVNVTAPV